MIVEKTTFRVDFVTRLSYLASRHSLEPRPLQVFILRFCCFLPDRPTHHHKTQDDGKRNILLGWPYLICSRSVEYLRDDDFLVGWRVVAFTVVPFQLWLYIGWKWCREKRRDQPTGVTVWMYWMLCLVMLILYYTTHICLYFVLQEIANNLARLSVDALARLGGYLCKWI